MLVDLRLPDMSGLEVVRVLKLGGGTARMVIVTAFPALDTAFDAAGAGADGYVDGPLWDSEIVDVVVQALTGPYPVRHPARRGGASIESPGTLRGVVDPRVQEVKRLIEDELDTSRPVSELALRVEWSESSLSHRFHACVGMSVTEYRTERRLQEAARRLVTTHQSVSQIAYGVGYRSGSLSDFRRDFAERFGMSPKEYRTRLWRGPTALP
jgi:AraC-like DNA-binding protein